MSDNKGAFSAVLKRKFPSESRIMDAFIASDNHHITVSLGDLIGKNNQKYQKVADIIEANCVADERLYRKWGSVQEQLNEAFFGFINWDTILEELDGERAKQEAVIQSTAKQREALRTRIPTTLIVHEPENKPSARNQTSPEIHLVSSSTPVARETNAQEPSKVSDDAESIADAVVPVQAVLPIIISHSKTEEPKVPEQTAKQKPVTREEPAQADKSAESPPPEHSTETAEISRPGEKLEPAQQEIEVPVHVSSSFEQASSEKNTAPKGFTPPSTKEELLEHVEKLYQQKKQELDAIHTKKIDLINTHGERLLHQAVDDFLSRIRKLENVAGKIHQVFHQEPLDPFLTSLHDHNTHQLHTKIAELQKSQTKRQNAINKSWQIAIENEELRNLEMHDKLKSQIAIAKETYSCIEDSGVLDLKKMTQSSESNPWNEMTINAYVQECKTRLLSDYLDEPALKHMRDTLLYLWGKTTEPEVLVDMVNIYGSLLFSHLAPQSKGKLISALIESMHNRSLVEAARILQHLADNEDLRYRLSEKDLKRVLSLVESQNLEIRAATYSLIEKQLRLEQEGLIPVSSTILSQKLEEAITHLSLRENGPDLWSNYATRRAK